MSGQEPYRRLLVLTVARRWGPVRWRPAAGGQSGDRSGAGGMVSPRQGVHRSWPAVWLALLLVAAPGPGRAAVPSSVFQLPSETFQLVAPRWLWAGHGFINDTDSVLWTGGAPTLCESFSSAGKVPSFCIISMIYSIRQALIPEGSSPYPASHQAHLSSLFIASGHT